MFSENRKSLIFEVLGVVVYFFIDKYVCIDYLFIQREEKLPSLYARFEDTSFNNLSGIGIPVILLNIFLCYGYIHDNDSTHILTCRIKLASY